MSATETTTAELAISAVLVELEDAGIAATDDAGKFFPAPVGVLVGLPTLVRRTLAGATFTVPVTVVSGDPLSDSRKRARLYALADSVAFALRIDQYRPSNWSGGANAEPLPAIEMAATISLGG